MPPQTPTSNQSMPAVRSRRSLPAWLNRTHMYGFEQFMALVGLLTTGWVLDYGWFALLNTLSRDSFASSIGQTSLIIVVAMIVWLPVTMFFFLRMRGHAQEQPEVNHTHLARFFNAAYLVMAVIAAIGFAFAAIYGLLNHFVSLTDQSLGSVLLKVTGPALLAVATELALVMAVARPRGWFSRGKFALWFSFLSLAVVTSLFVLSAGNIRSYALDEQAYNDISQISNSVQAYYDANHRLPNRLDDNLPHLSQDVASRLSHYQYVPKTSGQYELCTDFNKASSGYDASQPDDSYQAYVSPTHPDGHYCYHLKVYGYYSSGTLNLYQSNRSSTNNF